MAFSWVMAACSGGLPTPIDLKLVSRLHLSPLPWSGLESKKRRRTEYGCSVVSIRRTTAKKSVENVKEQRFDSKRSTRRARVQPTTALPFASHQYVPIFRITYIYVFVRTSQGALTFDRKKIESFYAFYKQNDERDETTSKSKISGIHQDKILKLCIL